jgi:hypothetical protein
MYDIYRQRGSDDQFQQLKDYLPFVAAITRINKYYTLIDKGAT